MAKKGTEAPADKTAELALPQLTSEKVVTPPGLSRVTEPTAPAAAGDTQSQPTAPRAVAPLAPPSTEFEKAVE